MTSRRNNLPRAYRRYVTDMQAATGCITPRRFLGVRGDYKLNETYAINLNEGDPVALATPHGGLFFSAGQQFRLIHDPAADAGPYRATTVSYWYQFMDDDYREIIVFHWTPESDMEGARLYPHLHVGSGLINPAGRFMPDGFSKLHIPTARVSLESVVLFAIEELSVKPIKNDWQGILGAGEMRFRQHRRTDLLPRLTEDAEDQ